MLPTIKIMTWKVTVSYRLNGIWKKITKEFNDEILMREKIKKYLENDQYEDKCYWIITTKEGEL